MSNPYVGEIRMFAGNFAPQGWMICDGSLLPISEYEVLFVLIGTTYGGDGQTTFALPDLRGRVPVHQGQGPGLSSYALGESGGSETSSLTLQQMPPHRHTMKASHDPATAGAGPGDSLASSPTLIYGDGTPDIAMAGGAITLAGLGQPHENMAPFLALNFIISVWGIFPSPT